MSSVHKPLIEPTIQAITFDLDDTLWEIWPIIARAEERLHAWLGEHYPQIPALFSPLELRQLTTEAAQSRPERAYDRTWLRKEALRLAAQRACCSDFCVESAFAVFYAARNDVVLFEDTLPVLERLARRYTLGALSNGNADIRQIGLTHVFAFAFNASDVGAAKPATALFEAACRHLGTAPERIVHVGDDPEGDIAGAARAGLRAVWLNRTAREWPGGPRADAEIRSLAELEALLESWENPPDVNPG